MTKSTNTAPYYNDFDEFKNYHQILFKPGFPVQARELTQIQSILKNQVSKLGDHIFQQGSIVIPGNSRGETGVPFIKLEDSFNGSALDMSLFEGATVIGVTSGVTAVIKKALTKTSTDPNLLYLHYTSGGVIGGVANGKLTFDLGEDVYVQSNPAIGATIQSADGSIGLGSMAFVNTGVYYVNGTFVSVAAQSIVIDKYTTAPTCRVLLQIVDSFVDSTQDNTLLDPAQGSYNFASPGADRYKIELVLTTLAYDATVSDNYVEIMRYNNGVLEEHALYPKYNELEKSLARRTYDESGDYVVNGLTGTFKEAKKVSINGGVDVNESIDNFAVVVNPGKAYIGGFEVEKLSNTTLIMPKARTVDHVKIKTMNARPEFGRYILVSNFSGAPSISTRANISLTNASGSSTAIGTARVLAIDYHIGDPALNTAIYKLWITEVVFDNTSHSMVNVGGVTFSGGTASVIQEITTPLSAGAYGIGNIINAAGGDRTGVVQYWDAPNSIIYAYKSNSAKELPFKGDQVIDATSGATSVAKSRNAYFGTSQNSAIFALPASPVKSLKNASNTYDAVVYAQKQVSISTNGSGNGSISIGDGAFLTPEAGNFVALSSAGTVATSHFTLSGANNVLNISGGPVNTTVYVYATVVKSSVSPRSKTLTTYIETLTVGSGVTSVKLGKSDVYRINSVTISGADVTGSYTFDSGQTDYAYYRGSLKLANGQTLPTGSITVSYDYFEHSSGDYFSADSYAGNADYLNLTLNYRSSAGQIFNLLNSIDCRPVVGNDGLGFGTGAIVGDMLVNEELFTSSVQYFVSRYDVLTLNKDGAIKILSGVPAESPVVPVIPADLLAIETYFIPAYTQFVNLIKKTRNMVDRYTMKGIAKIEKRVSNLEKFSTLTAAESALINQDVLDAATGLGRFKSGYLVESFDEPFTIADSANAQFHAAFSNATMSSAIERMDCAATVKNTSSHFVNVNGIYMLPYSEVVFASQPVSSRVTNINPFQVISWNGHATVSPNIDTWVDIVDLPEIFNTINKPDIHLINWIPSPLGSPSIPQTNLPVTSPSSGGDFIGDFFGGVLGAVGAVGEVVTDVFGGVVDAVGDVVSSITSCCVVATALTQQGEWEPERVVDLTQWANDKLDKSFLGLALHKGYHVVGPAVLIPMIRRGGLQGKYIKHTFDNATKMLQGKKFDLIAIPSVAAWLVGLTVVGLFVTKEYATSCWKKLYRKDSRK